MSPEVLCISIYVSVYVTFMFFSQQLFSYFKQCYQCYQMIRQSEKCATVWYSTARIYDKSITMKDWFCVYVNLNVFSSSNCYQYLLS